MNVLLVKTSSLGDLLHALPAVTDAQRLVPDLRVDWVVEEAYAQIPAWHPAVRRVITVALRRWRHQPLDAWRSGEWQRFQCGLQASHYDRVVDAQGLLKSALITRLARGERWGYSLRSAREPLAAIAYQRAVPVARGQHAVRRLRELFAAALGYSLGETPLDYGVGGSFPHRPRKGPLVFLHGTTWHSKRWPLPEWQRLAALAGTCGWRVRLPWATLQERLRAERIAAAGPHVEVLPAGTLGTLAAVINEARAVVGVDTGLAHLAAALNVPSVTLYAASDPGLTGTVGTGQRRLQAQYPCAPCLRRVCPKTSASAPSPPCYRTLGADQVWAVLQDMLTEDCKG